MLTFIDGRNHGFFFLIVMPYGILHILEAWKLLTPECRHEHVFPFFLFCSFFCLIDTELCYFACLFSCTSVKIWLECLLHKSIFNVNKIHLWPLLHFPYSYQAVEFWVRWREEMLMISYLFANFFKASKSPSSTVHAPQILAGNWGLVCKAMMSLWMIKIHIICNTQLQCEGDVKGA